MRKKTCTKCLKKKPLSDKHFHRNGQTADGGQAWRARCRDCENVIHARLKRERRNGRTKDPGPQPIRKRLPTSKTYVITYAQNATSVYLPFLRSLETYCKENNAELIVMPGRYKNPTSIYSEGMRTEEWWATELHPYLFEGRKTLGGHITIYGDISIPPTQQRPLSSFEVFAGKHSAIFGHPKIQLKTVPTAKRRYPRIFTTTGAVTRPNYTKSKAGKKAEAHHTYGATVVEQGTKLFHVRQINATRDGTFIDLATKYTPDGIEPAERALALVPGDIHVDMEDAEVLEATFYREDSICAALKPKRIVYHDTLHFETRNHHTIHDFQMRFERVRGNRRDNVEEEVERAIGFIDETPGHDTEIIVVASNHDDAFDRWLNTADPKGDPVNAAFFYECNAKRLRAYEESGKWTPAFELLYKERGEGRARFLRRDQPEQVAGIYVNFHGDMGLNGARPSHLTYAKLGVKTIIGHSHTPGIMDGCYQVGVTGRLEQDYNFLPSTWLHSHCVVYANGKRSLIHVIHGEWRG